MEKIDMTAPLSALAQPTRRAIFVAIAKSKDGLNSTDVAEVTGTMPTNTSAHLTVLRNADLVNAQRIGKAVKYTAQREKVRALAQYLSSLVD